MTHFIDRILITALLVFASLPAIAQSGKNAIRGVWYNHDKSAKIEVYKCKDEKNEFCGKIIWLKKSKDENGKPRTDIKNSNEQLQDRALMGMRIMSGFKYEGDNRWEDGDLYDLEKGKTYVGYMELQENGSLKMVGYIGFSLMPRTMIWTRAR